MNCLLAACRQIGTARRYPVQIPTVHRHPPPHRLPRLRWNWQTAGRTASTATSTTERAPCTRATITSNIRAESTKTTGPSITTGHPRLRPTLSTNRQQCIRKWSMTYLRTLLYSSMPISTQSRLLSVQRRELTTIGNVLFLFFSISYKNLVILNCCYWVVYLFILFCSKDFARGAVATRSSLASSDSELSQPNTRPHSRQTGNKMKPLRSR